MTSDASQRRFVLLQGPHGPFFAQLARRLSDAGADVIRVAFNSGDALFAGRTARQVRFTGEAETFGDWFRAFVADAGITDVVVYGETRQIHATALAIARINGLGTHIFEEGYLRPYWVTYEREGSNGNSPVLRMSMDDMAAATQSAAHPHHEVPAHWGDMRQHVFYGALYHAAVLMPSRRYQNYVSHRDITVAQEARLNAKQLLLMPWNRLVRAVTTLRFRRRALAYHLCLLQLEHDASLRSFSTFDSAEAFLDCVLDGFARGAPKHHHLVFKAHPLEDGRAPLSRMITAGAKSRGIDDRVHFLTGGKLARLLNSARSVVTINSTAAQQALWRGLPVKALGTAVYSRRELVSDQSLPDFFAAPRPPDAGAYDIFRSYLLRSCQFSGGFYSAAGRRELLPEITDALLAREEHTAKPSAASVQHLRAVP
ncbi:MAG: capsule biosynthesis protein CapA [Rhodobacteraceae bacterium]|nr:capsule biosynthesis protein CapA [Paracoccaceae bacterium]